MIIWPWGAQRGSTHPENAGTYQEEGKILAKPAKLRDGASVSSGARRVNNRDGACTEAVCARKPKGRGADVVRQWGAVDEVNRGVGALAQVVRARGAEPTVADAQGQWKSRSWRSLDDMEPPVERCRPRGRGCKQEGQGGAELMVADTQHQRAPRYFGGAIRKGGGGAGARALEDRGRGGKTDVDDVKQQREPRSWRRAWK
ncbi:hypothetical protein C8F04DRAFT_1196482 [Mycena alexandri]|uniref:Uncharacterized protein n=1 Tax=Mycena alexandri TaxID=1745969 RepID=A0AAD6WR40_9AGAR|nr:hypothetical protein C8F04DRAFT_1196482 [Mycena alexandri]